MPTIHLGISTCPNDTFAFHGLLNHCVDWRGLQFEVELIDIQQLNNRLFAGEFDVAKTSFHAALLLSDQTVVLPSGSALGFGVGPLLLAARSDERPENSAQTTICPGQDTTATLLFQLFYPETTEIRHVLFSEIMPDLTQGKADFGVCIHEGRFTWQNVGLSLVEDLGTRWEQETFCPLPLGGIVARRSLSHDTIAAVQAVIHDSLQLALADRSLALPTMRKYAQEFDDTVLMQHVDLYVNDWTINLGNVGKNALKQLSRLAQERGLIAADSPELEIFTD
jgi:1,4-dihydroxy-6-naphthoate synthase